MDHCFVLCSATRQSDVYKTTSGPLFSNKLNQTLNAFMASPNSNFPLVFQNIFGKNVYLSAPKVTNNSPLVARRAELLVSAHISRNYFSSSIIPPHQTSYSSVWRWILPPPLPLLLKLARQYRTKFVKLAPFLHSKTESLWLGFNTSIESWFWTNK